MKSPKMAEFTGAKTRRQKVEDRETAILAVARDMFNAQGYEKTTMSLIAKNSGVADGTVYLYFKNKEALARGVLARFYSDLTEVAQRGVDKRDNPKSRLRFLAKHHLNEIIINHRLLEFLPQNDMAIDNYEGSDLYKMNRSYVAVFDRVAREGLAQGIIRPKLAPWILRDMFFGALHYASRTLLMKGKREDMQVFIDGIISMMTHDGGEAQLRAEPGKRTGAGIGTSTGSSISTGAGINTGMGIRAELSTSLDALTRLEALTDRIELATHVLERKL